LTAAQLKRSYKGHDAHQALPDVRARAPDLQWVVIAERVGAALLALGLRGS
jgi:hypothetical protein